MTAVDCSFGNSLSEETDGEVFRLDEINQNDVVCMEEETCVGVPEGCQDVAEMEEDCRDDSRECCKGIYELNEELMRERCGGMLEDACKQVSLEEGAMEEWIFSSDDEDETNEVSGVAIDGLWTKKSDFGVMSPAGMDGG